MPTNITVVLGHAQSLVADALTVALDSAGLLVLATCTNTADLGWAVLDHRPDVCVLDEALADDFLAASHQPSLSEIRVASLGCDLVMLVTSASAVGWSLYDAERSMAWCLPEATWTSLSRPFRRCAWAHDRSSP